MALKSMKPVKLEKKDLTRLFITDTPLARGWRKFKRFVRSLLYLFGLYLVLYFALNFTAITGRVKYDVSPGSVAISQPTPAVETSTRPTVKPNYQPMVTIPKIGVNAPLILNIAPDQIVANLANGVVHYQDTALPGEIGNTVIVGHSSDYPWSNGHYKNIFALLDKLVPGDKITIPYTDQVFVYEVTDSKIVKPTDLSVLQMSSTPQLTLITCYPVGTSRNRLIVTAKLVEGTPTGTQTSQPSVLGSLPNPR